MRYSLPVTLLFVLLPLALGTRQTRADDETLEQRRERLERMSDVEKTRLLQKKSRFDELSDQDQDRLRKLQQQLAADPQCEHLRGVLERYSDWLKTLTPVERAELATLAPDKRLAHIKALVSDQDARRFRAMVGGFLNPKDLGAIRTWLDEFVKAHAAEILATVPDDPRFEEVKKSFDAEKNQHQLFLRFWYLHHEGTALPQPTKQEEEQLKSRLSPEARAVLGKATNDAERSRIIQNWTRAADFSSRVPPRVSQEELDRFVKDELSESERVYLESLPRDRMYRELRSKYYQKRFGPGPGGKPGMRGPGGRRGSGGRPGFDGRPPGEGGLSLPPRPDPPPGDGLPPAHGGEDAPDFPDRGESGSGSTLRQQRFR